MTSRGPFWQQPFCDSVKCHQLTIVSKTTAVNSLQRPFLRDVARPLESISVIFVIANILSCKQFLLELGTVSLFLYHKSWYKFSLCIHIFQCVMKNCWYREDIVRNKIAKHWKEKKYYMNCKITSLINSHSFITARNIVWYVLSVIDKVMKYTEKWWAKYIVYDKWITKHIEIM